MALEKLSTPTEKYITIVNGLWAERLPPGTTGTDVYTRTLEKGDNAGMEVTERRMDGYSGRIVGASIEDSRFGSVLNIKVDDDERVVRLQLPVNSAFFDAFAKRIPNLDEGAWVTFGLFTDKEQDRTRLYMKQEKEKLSPAFTREEPNGLPPAEKKTIQGKEKWCFEEQKNFLYNLVNEWCNAWTDDITLDLDEEVPF